MLKRTYLRRYLLALLCSEDVPQNIDCETGPLWVNCDDTEVLVLDHDSHQIFEDVEGCPDIGERCIALAFQFENVEYEICPTAINSTDISLRIDIISHDSSGAKRQNALDEVEEKIWHRLFSYASFVDATTGEALNSFMRWANQNTIRVQTRDESDIDGDYTIRAMTLSLSTKDCIERLGCDDVPICFDFDDLTRLDKPD